MKKSLKKLDTKKMTGLTTLGVSVLSLTILLLTGWFIVKTLNEVAVAKTSDNAKSLKIQGVNNQLLDKVQQFVTDKGSDSRKLGDGLRNPFEKPVPVPAPVPPTPPAPEVPASPAAPAETTPPAAPPATTPPAAPSK